MSIVYPRFAVYAIVEQARSRRCSPATTARRQDKKPHIAARSGGCCDYDFWSFARIAAIACEVRAVNLLNAFSENRTSRNVP